MLFVIFQQNPAPKPHKNAPAVYKARAFVVLDESHTSFEKVPEAECGLSINLILDDMFWVFSFFVRPFSYKARDTAVPARQAPSACRQ